MLCLLYVLFDSQTGQTLNARESLERSGGEIRYDVQTKLKNPDDVRLSILPCGSNSTNHLITAGKSVSYPLVVVVRSLFG